MNCESGRLCEAMNISSPHTSGWVIGNAQIPSIMLTVEKS